MAILSAVLLRAKAVGIDGTGAVTASMPLPFLDDFDNVNGIAGLGGDLYLLVTTATNSHVVIHLDLP